MAAPMTATDREIRKLRKKLRQIENLERLNRDLLEEEIIKINKKNSIRAHLQELLILVHQDTAQNKQHDQENNGSAKDAVSASHQSTEKRIAKPDNLHLQNSSGDVQRPSSHEIGCNSSASMKSSDHSNNVDSVAGDNVNAEKAAETRKGVKKKAAKHHWRRVQFEVCELEGHNDLITSLDTNGKLLVTASHDTTIKLWDLSTFEEIRSFGGHTGWVMCILLMGQQDSNTIGSQYGLVDGSLLLLSGSLDCSFKIWAVDTGQIIKSVYTYSPVTKIAYISERRLIITVSGGGKLELWDIASAENMNSICIHDEAITGLKIYEKNIFTCSADGVIKVHQLYGQKLSCQFESENLKTTEGIPLTQRPIRSLAVADNKIYFGDDGINIKVLNWKKGIVHKLLNHTEEFGVTDAICCQKQLLLTSGYDFDNGLAYINVRILPEGDYVGTLNDEATSQIKDIVCLKTPSNNLMLITAGGELKVWKMVLNERTKKQDEQLLSTRYLPFLAVSGQESCVETDTSEDEDNVLEQVPIKKISNPVKHSQSGWFSWCSVL